MGTLYEKASDAVYDRAQEIIERCHPGIAKAEVKIDFIFAHAPLDDNGYPTGPAIKWHGFQAFGLCRILPIKDRAMGRGDAEIILDGDRWNHWDEDQQNALIDHEVTHISLVINRKGILTLDDLGRPKLKMRKHDFEVGWFHSIAERYGAASFEVQQARVLQAEAGKFYFQSEFGFNPKVAEVA